MLVPVYVVRREGHMALEAIELALELLCDLGPAHPPEEGSRDQLAHRRQDTGGRQPGHRPERRAERQVEMQADGEVTYADLDRVLQTLVDRGVAILRGTPAIETELEALFAVEDAVEPGQ